MANDTLSPTLFQEGQPQQPSTPPFTDVMPPMRSVGSFGDPEQAPVVASPSQPDGAYSIAYPYLLPPYRPMASVPDYPLMGVYSQLPTTGTTINEPSLFTPGYMIWRGEYQVGFQYNVDDVVYQNVSTYIAIQSNNNNPPDENIGTYWQLVGENFNYRGQWAPNPLLNVQTNYASGGSQTFTCAYSSNVTAGNWLYAVYNAIYFTGTTSNVPSVTDSLGNTWTQLGTTIIAQGNSGNNVIQQAIFGCQSAFSGANTVTFTGTSGVSIATGRGQIFEYGELLVGGFGTPSFATVSIFTGGIGQDVIIPEEGAVLISAGFANLHNFAVIGFDPAYFTKQNSNDNTGSGTQLVTAGGYQAAVNALYGVTSNVPSSTYGATAHIVPLLRPTVYNTAYNPFDLVQYLGSAYVCILPTNSDPIDGLGTSWVLIAQGLGYSVPQTATYTALSTDSGRQENFTISAPTTLNLPATIPANPGWNIWAMNNPSSTSTLSVSPNGLDLNGGTGTYALQPGQGVQIFTDGSNYFTQGVVTLQAAGVNAQTGTTYTILASDLGKLITFTNAAAIAVTLPVASTTGFGSTWYCDVQNIGAVGQGWVTITPTTSTIDGAATLIVQAGSGVRIFSDGTNYFTNRGAAALTLDNLNDTSLPRTAQYFRPAQFTTDVCCDNSSFLASPYLVNGAPPGWYNATVADGTASYNTSTPYIGNQCLQITGKNGADIANCRVITVMPGETYEVSGWIKTDGVCQGQIELIYANYPITTAGTIIASSSSSSWAYVSNTGTIPTTTGSGGYVLGILACTLGSGSAGSVANFQNIRIHRIFGASGTYSSPGMVPDPGQSAGTTRFLREDATWQAVSTTPSFSTLTSGTNTGAAMVVGTGASLATSGSGTIAATSVPFSGISSATNTTAAMVLGTGSSLTVSGSGTNNATSVDGVTVTGTPTAGQVITAASGTAASWQTVSATAVNAIPIPNIARTWYWQFDQSSAVGTSTASLFSGGIYMTILNGNSTIANKTFGYACGAYNGGTAGTQTYFLTKPIFFVGNGIGMTTFMSWFNASSAASAANWLGFSDQTPNTMLGGANPAGNYAAFRFINGTDTHFQCVTKDGTTQTVTDSGITPSAAFWASTGGYTFQIISNDAIPNVQFYINGALVATNTTHLPTAGTGLQWMNAQKANTNVGVGCEVSYVYLQASI